jgi:FlaG/FlaF family flagellin (archaellin)
LNKIIFRKRRAVSETIGTMMILVVTVAGAVLLSNLLSEGLFSVDQNPVVDARLDSIQLTSYDTRDSVKLTNVRNLNNTFNQMLCTNGDSAECTIVAADNLPVNDGTEFIVLQIRNMNVNPVFIHNVLINNVGHTWDDQSVGLLDLTNNLGAGGNYPAAGKFSIIPVENNYQATQQFTTNQIQGDQEVKLVIKLSSNIPQDIGMWSSLRVLVNFGGPQPAEFIILSGDSKW